MIITAGFALEGPRGRVFQDVSFTAPPGSLVAIEGPSGSGRTCLLLALTGRMRATAGHAEVGGQPLPKRMATVRRFSALGPVAGVTDLDPALTVAEHLRERVLLQRHFSESLRTLLRPRREKTAAAQQRINEALAAAGLDLEQLPKGPRTAVRDLDRLQALRLGVALALIGRPKLLAVDDVDHKLSSGERKQAWAMLRAIAGGDRREALPRQAGGPGEGPPPAEGRGREGGTTVLAVCAEAPEGAVVVRTGKTTEKEGAADAHAEVGNA